VEEEVMVAVHTIDQVVVAVVVHLMIDQVAAAVVVHLMIDQVAVGKK
jgi:hypothetical protein